MYAAIKQIHDTFTENGLKHKVNQVDESWILNAGVGGKASNYDFLFIKTDDDGNDVAVRIFDVVKFPENRMDKGYEIINKLQETYRFVRFNLDPDGGVNVEYDFPVAYTNVGDGAVEILIRITKILDDCYPELMRAIWG